MSQRPTAAEFTKWNEEMIRRFDPDLYHTASPLPVRLVEALRVRAIRRMLDAGPASRVLEIGCGGGNVLERVPGHRFGLDLSPYILNKAQRRLGPDVPLVRGDALQLPFADGAFDRVFCSEVLEHVLEPARLIAEMRRVLAPGGFAVVSVPNEAMINRVKRVLFAVPFARRVLGGSDYHMSEDMTNEWHLHEFDRRMLASVTEAQFRLDRVRAVPSAAMPLRLVARLQPR